MLRPFPEFGDVQYSDPVGYSWYHSLQSRLEKRFTHGFTLQVSYTWSKAMEATSFLNASDPMPYESLASIDRTHRFAGSGIWELPFGKGRHFGTNMSQPARFPPRWMAIERRHAAPERSADRLGQMIIVGDSTKIALPSTERNTDRWFNTSVFATGSAATALTPASNIRTFPLRFSNIRFDSQRRWDFSLNKSFRLTEAARLRFRADVFNALNEPVLRGPSTTATSGAFATITAQEPPRSFQFSLQLNF